MEHVGIRKKFPSYFNNFILPNEAVEKSLKVYRACKTQKVEKESFLPSYEENNFSVLQEPIDPGEYSLSVYEKPKDVKRFAKLNGNFNPPYKIAIGTTEPCCGIVQKTIERTGEKTSHVDWWLYENTVPYEHFEMIDDFEVYFNEYMKKR